MHNSELSQLHVRKPILWKHKSKDNTGQVVVHHHEHKHHGADGTSASHPTHHHRSELNTIPISTLTNMRTKDLDELWNRYDKNHNEFLDKEEIEHLSIDLVSRLMKVIDTEIHLIYSHLSQEEIDNLIMKEREKILPGCITLKQAEQELINRLLATMDLNQDHTISRDEFRAKFTTFTKELFNVNLDTDDSFCSLM